uniref:Uncharacterized protein n=1 Tax=Tetranychus urticae TaxID=32264 RepID=T1K6T5_TETUR
MKSLTKIKSNAEFQDKIEPKMPKPNGTNLARFSNHLHNFPPF